MQDCTGCRCQCFGSGGTAGMASVRRDQGLPVPYPSKIDPPQGTVEPISKAGGYSGRTYIRKGKKWQRGRGGGSKKHRECQGQRIRWRCSMEPQQAFTVSRGQPTLKEGRKEEQTICGWVGVWLLAQEERDNNLFVCLTFNGFCGYVSLLQCVSRGYFLAVWFLNRHRFIIQLHANQCLKLSWPSEHLAALDL